jgi:hypothetical protein
MAGHALRLARGRGISTETAGAHLFKGAVAAPYLSKHGLAADALDSAAWVASDSDKVAAAVADWANDNGADTFCHWFQPVGASGVRPGLTGQVQNKMLEFTAEGTLATDFKGKDLTQGETDGSSFPNGGLRGTHRAGGYLAIDPSSPIFLRDDTIFIPSCFGSYYGHALDEKTPLLRASQKMSKEGTRLLKALGYDVDGIQANIGLEQEFFLGPGQLAALKRPWIFIEYLFPMTVLYGAAASERIWPGQSRATPTTAASTCRWPAAPSSARTPPAARRCATTTWRRRRSPARRWPACSRCRRSALSSASRLRPATERSRRTSSSLRRSSAP